MLRYLGIVLFACASCSVAPPPEVAPGCNPLVGDDCLTPFPSAFFEQADSSSATGVRVALDSAQLPVTTSGIAYDPSRLNRLDGFSPATPFLVYFKAGVEASQLPTASDPAASMRADAAVQILRADSGQRVPLDAELDPTAEATDRRALIIRPLERLLPGTRYIVALVGLRDATGRPLAPAPFVALRDRTPLSRSLRPLAASYERIFATLAGAGIARSQVTLAWDVVTASDATATAHLLGMRDQALAMADAGKLGYHIDQQSASTDPHLLRDIHGTVDVPRYLTDDSPTAHLRFDGDGRPLAEGIGQAQFVVHIPSCAHGRTHALPVLVFGHGLFQDAEAELSDSRATELADRLCMVEVATDWLGITSDDLHNILDRVVPDFNQFPLITDRLQQAQINAQVLVRLFLRHIKDDPALAVDGSPVSDGKEIYYYGISAGGIEGATFLALSPDVARGVLNVPGCEWSLMMLRSYAFASLKPLVSNSYPDLLDQQVLVALSQSQWDYTDPATFAPHLLDDPLPGAAAHKTVLVQEAIGDSMVPNIATRILVRTLGLPGMALEHPVYGVAEKSGPLASAYTQWDVQPSPLPPDDDRPATEDNGAHESVWRLDAAQLQLTRFLRPDGNVQQTCSGSCVFTADR